MDKCAIFIDGDNVNWTYLPPFIRYLATRDIVPSEIHLFGNLRNGYTRDWMTFCQYNLIPHDSEVSKQYKKNSTDMGLTALAFSYAYTESFQTLCVLSSDSDYSHFLGYLPSTVHAILGYQESKVSHRYLAGLPQTVEQIPLEQLRGTLSSTTVRRIVNATKKRIVQYKIANFFTYDCLRDWIISTYPDLAYLSVSDLSGMCDDLVLHFTQHKMTVSGEVHQGGNANTDTIEVG